MFNRTESVSAKLGDHVVYYDSSTSQLFVRRNIGDFFKLIKTYKPVFVSSVYSQCENFLLSNGKVHI